MISRSSILAAALLFLICAPISLALTDEEVAKVNVYLQEGGVLIKENKSKEAVEKFRAAKELAPTSALVMCNLGFALERYGKYDEALENLKESIRIDPKIPIAWVNLAGLYQSTGRIPEAIDTFDEYLRRFPTDANAKDARSIVAILRDTKAVNTANKVTGDTPDYYSSAVRDGVQKWDSSRFPLKVFISKGNPAQGYLNSFAGQIRNAFTEWQGKANNAVSFVFVDSAADADIDVNWTNDESQVAKKGEAGDCRTRFGTRGIEHAVITMLMISLSDSIPLGDSLIHWVGMHEIGHALGIHGHSVNSNDIMYATMTYDYDRKGVSSRDVATLMHLYQPGLKATGSPNELFNETVKELNTQTRMPPEQQKLLPIITNFENLKAQFPTFELVNGPLAYAYCNHGTMLLRQNRFEEAAGFYQKALPLLNKQKDSGTGATVRQNYAIALKQLHRDADAAAVLAGQNR